MGRQRWYGAQNLTTKLESSPREQKGEGGRLTDIKPGEQIGTASDWKEEAVR